MSFPSGSAAHAIEIAKAEIGYVETPDNITKYGEAMKANGLPWCGSFCNWVLKEAGVKVHSVVTIINPTKSFKLVTFKFIDPMCHLSLPHPVPLNMTPGAV